ncbi:hypothetical protein [Actinoalloteichus hymeniacidonis]|uniref:Uncharacterized protein n=1 Tax=Actinoalloteichus hymeniacidonis TaxID=340345 RepID=A0AAC9HKE4_9PSEU|nr:hypothetical protein [Actinoalloteichus hymeniacidonis]AOS60865.1 hypothetical protein TL08_00075 [Actinoalloteichus hymeniacidonis]MBB5905686.1 multidrug efflux pump subunit AcrA (membrane-fusion protein) [Actinoalloteichus hymeniacidonis]
MDEVRAMAAAGESVGRAMGSGVRTVREGAQRASKAGTEATVKAARKAARSAEAQLAERRLTPQQLAELIESKARQGKITVASNKKKLRKQQARTGRDLRKAGKSARRELEKQLAGARKRRRWPWVLGLIALGGAAYVLSKRPEVDTIAVDEAFDSNDAMHSSGRESNETVSRNGSSPSHRADKPASVDGDATNRS